jgi:hypothetical protein
MLVKQIGKKIQDATGEKLSTFYLFQSISMAIQKGNAVCVMYMYVYVIYLPLSEYLLQTDDLID